MSSVKEKIFSEMEKFNTKGFTFSKKRLKKYTAGVIDFTLDEVEKQLDIEIHNFKSHGWFLNPGEVIETIKQIIKEMKKMKIAFDYGDTLDKYEEIRELAKALSKEHEVIAISGIPEEMTKEERLQALMDMGIDFKDIFIITHPNKKTKETSYQVGLEKAKIMKQIGCKIIIDNEPQIIKAIRKEGLIALHI